MKTYTDPIHPAPGSLSQTGFLPQRRWTHRLWMGSLSLLLLAGAWSVARAAEHTAPVEAVASPVTTGKATPQKTASDAAAATGSVDIGADIKKAIREQMLGKKTFTVVIPGKPEKVPTETPSAATKQAASSHAKPEAPVTPKEELIYAPAVAAHPGAETPKLVVNPRASREYIKARAAKLAGHAIEEPKHVDEHAADVHWSYAGKGGPQAWGQLKPEFNTCAIGKRQSPINIEDSYTLQGPAEPLHFNYQPSTGTVVNNGHTIQVNVEGNNTLTVRGSVYNLVQFHFHTPSEMQVNYRSYAMVAHLVHKNAQGELAVVAVLLDPGQANALIDKVWTYMPLDVGDEVRMPPGLLDLNELLPKDQRYYQFLGSLTTPPCTEGVLWMVIKQPTQISAAQLHLFQQLYPSNARPVQPVNGRPIRNAQ
ncbi:carbonic anhydrase family protein [Rhodoferax sp.]|uniref:carbonic anhydrase n=1 Tax=Rhodoferax sp. TaxID=50421 RepID=UPI00283F6276|nr:carbonic anhydrase family protein [Rhodoferax sp.]MDR3367619.1 carbonic anhydrase family protein [Rhodoferax sp.]